VQERGATRVALLLASDAWGLGDEMERAWALVEGLREEKRDAREETKILSKIWIGSFSFLPTE
jgi:hypothetical protein